MIFKNHKVQKLQSELYKTFLVHKNKKMRLIKIFHNKIEYLRLIINSKQPKSLQNIQKKYFCHKSKQLIDKVINFNNRFNINFKYQNLFLFSTLKQTIHIDMQAENKSKQIQNILKQQIKTEENQQNDSNQTELYKELPNSIEQFDHKLFQHSKIIEKSKQQTEQVKSRNLKRKQRLAQKRTESQDPEIRKQRNRLRHQMEKDKLQKRLQGLSQQEVRAILDSRKTQKNDQKQKVRKAVQDQIGQPFLIDLAYEHRMNQKQNKSLAIQIQLIMKSLRKVQTPPNVHICGVQEGRVKDQLLKMKYQLWPIKHYEQPLEQCLKMEKFKNKNVYYLSPDAKKTIDTIGQNDIFIIGGLVDRTVIKDASLNRAEKLGIQARSLPIRPFMKQRSCLNLDHIVSIVCKFVEVKDWKQAFEFGAPKRWKKQEGQTGLKQISSSQSQEQWKQQAQYQNNESNSQIKQIIDTKSDAQKNST